MAKWTNFTFFHPALITTYKDDASLAVAADALVVPLTAPFIAKTTGGDAEAMTLANGIEGQTVTINILVDGGGDATITPVTSIGWATVVMADAGDQVTFGYIDDTDGWMILAAHGLVQPPVITA
jgi:hypothetical protein